MKIEYGRMSVDELQQQYEGTLIQGERLYSPPMTQTQGLILIALVAVLDLLTAIGLGVLITSLG